MKQIDLFCGIGGFHAALRQLGATCVLACDIDKDCRKVYKNNWGIEPHSDITTLQSKDIPDFDLLCGGFPCQAFSHAGKQGGFEDTRGTLFREIARILKDKQPKQYLLENVKNLKSHDKGNTIQTIQNALKEVGQTAYPEPILLSPHQLGIPQHRERVFLLGIRNDLVVGKTIQSFPKLKEKPCDISSILESVEYPELKLTDEQISVLNHWETFIQFFKSKKVKLPTFPIWTESWKSVADISHEPKWKQNFIEKNKAFYKDHQEFLESWLSSAPFSGAKSKLEWQCGNWQTEDSLWNLLFTFRPSGIRVKRTNQSPALVAMSQIVVVGSKKRKLSPREVARLQSFPDTFQLPSARIAYKQFGNSVNVEVIKRMASFLTEEMIKSS